MTERLLEYGAEVVETSPADLPATIARQLQSSGRQTFVAPPGLPADWLDPEINWKLDNNLSHRGDRALRRRPHRFFRGHRRFRHHRPPSLSQRRPPRPHPAAGLPSLHSSRFAGRRDPARILRSLPGTSAPRHVHLRPQRHRRHRNDPHQRRPWPPFSQRDPRPRRATEHFPAQNLLGVQVCIRA